MTIISNRNALSILAICLSFVIPTGSARTEGQKEALFFLSTDVLTSTGVSDPSVEKSDVTPAVDFLYTYSTDRFRLLIEYLLSDEEAELERLQFGWEVGEESMIWLGRFHRPSGYWNTAYHHGEYLQTSISRPGIEEWEDDGGPIPSHSTGMLAQFGKHFDSSAGLQAAFSIGLAPAFEADGLEPFDFLDPDDIDGPAADFRLSFLPDYFEDSQFGLLLGWSDIEVARQITQPPALAGLQDIEQVNAGIYADWHWERWRFIGSVFNVMNRLRTNAGSFDDVFTAGYVQGEFEPSDDWTVYGRLEQTHDEEDSEYLRLFPDFVARRLSLGVRYELAARHALKFELARTETLMDEFGQFRLQWSAALP